jgi:lipopolysaccharide export system protein LptA
MRRFAVAVTLAALAGAALVGAVGNAQPLPEKPRKYTIVAGDTVIELYPAPETKLEGQAARVEHDVRTGAVKLSGDVRVTVQEGHRRLMQISGREVVLKGVEPQIKPAQN